MFGRPHFDSKWSQMTADESFRLVAVYISDFLQSHTDYGSPSHKGLSRCGKCLASPRSRGC